MQQVRLMGDTLMKDIVKCGGRMRRCYSDLFSGLKLNQQA